MEIVLKSREEVWRKPGRPRTQIPEQIRRMADATYRTGKVAELTIEPGKEKEAAELVRLLRCYARQTSRRVKVQQDNRKLRFEMVDRKNG